MEKLNIKKRNGEICRLCLEKIVHSEGEKLNVAKIDMLKLLSVNLLFPIINDQMICSICCLKLHQGFDFKMVCLNNEKQIKALLNCGEMNILNLDQLFHKQLVVPQPITSEENKVCRFCLKLHAIQTSVHLNGINQDIFLEDLIYKCFPEMDFSLSSEPIMCIGCMESLQNLFNFIVGCFDANEVIKYYLSSVELSSTELIDLLDVFDFMSNLKMEPDNDFNLNYVKVERELRKIHCIESDITIKEELPDEETLLRGGCRGNKQIIAKTKNNPFFVKLHSVRQNLCYSCYHCPYKTSNRSSLILHLLVHKNSNDTPKIKCNLCDFETKWRTSLRTHMFLHKAKSELIMYKCAKCSYQSKFKKHLRRHMGVHNPIKYLCEDCPFKTKYMRVYKNHCKRSHNVEGSLKKVEVGSLNNVEVGNLNKVEVDNLIKVGDTKDKIKIKKNYKCAHCSYETPRSCRIKEHIVKHQSKSEAPAYGCDLCPFKSKYKASLSHHKKLHQNKRYIKPKITEESIIKHEP